MKTHPKKPLLLFYVSLKSSLTYETVIEDAVVAAVSREAAKTIHPFDGSTIKSWPADKWCRHKRDIAVECIGIAAEHIVRGRVCFSYRMST